MKNRGDGGHPFAELNTTGPFEDVEVGSVRKPSRWSRHHRLLLRVACFVHQRLF